MMIEKFAKTALALALVASGSAYAGTSSQSLTKQLGAVSTTGVAAQPAVARPRLTSQQELKAFYASLSPKGRKALRDAYDASPPSVKAAYRKIYSDLPVSPA